MSFHARDAREVLRTARVDPRRGLAEAEARRRLREHGPNRLRESRRRSAGRILLDQLTSILVGLLAAAAALAFLFDERAEGAAILAVLVANTGIGFFAERQALRSMEALRRIARTVTKVRRDGAVREIAAERLVPGDIVLLEAGDVVTADLRLFEAAGLACDESTVTGESVPVDKAVAPVPEDAAPAERRGMAFKGTAVTRGSAEGVVVATGMATELGRVSALVEEAARESSPMQRRLDRLGGRLAWLTLGIAALIAAGGIATGRDVVSMVKMGIALAVAAVPEGLPIVATLAMARGMWRMARRHAVVKHLSAVETLGATTVILTDKTGTLTENRMAVVRLALAGRDVDLADAAPAIAAGRPGAADDVRRLLEVGVLCNNASLSGQGPAVGDPMEGALLEAGARAGLDQATLLARMPELRQEPFDPGRKMMATVHRTDGGCLVAVKGAPEAVLAAAATVLGPDGSAQPLGPVERRAWCRRNQELAAAGLRVLALATRSAPAAEAVDPFSRLVFLGLAGLLDPPRGDVREALAACRRAGVRVVMVTGDQGGTARTVASAVGLDEADGLVLEGRQVSAATAGEIRRATVLARVTPEQKLDVVAAYQGCGEIVAMTGDGVNDAPALRKADIGIAMGRRGTPVAREAADIVLADDAFATIVAAMEEGRVIFGNIRTFVLYLLSCNLSEILVVAVAVTGGLPLPLLPLQILFLNLVTDVLPAFALGAGEGEAGVMQRPPRPPAEPIVRRRDWLAIGAHGAVITAATLGAFALALDGLGLEAVPATTVAFLALAFGQLWHVFNMRRPGTPLLHNEVTGSLKVWAAVALCAGMTALAVHVAWLADVLHLRAPTVAQWGLALVASLVPLALGPLVNRVRR